MTLLDAAAAVLPRDRLVVATFDHSTGAAATAACALVARRCGELAVQVIRGQRTEDRGQRTEDRGQSGGSSEEAFREARWSFLRRVAADHGAHIATAHTQTDQVETVLMRVMRDAGARGLAALYADTGVERPLISFSRQHVAAYAEEKGVKWVEDPTNALRHYARNRVRHDLLPALRRVRPEFDRELLDVARAAAAWRREVEAFVDAALGGEKTDIPVAWLANRTRDELCVLWPTISARVGVTLDRRGTERLAAFTQMARVGSHVPLGGGWRVFRARDAWQLRASPTGRPSPASLLDGRLVRWGNWSFRPTSGSDADDATTAWLPTDDSLSVRCWEAGDAMIVRAGAAPRKVKQLLSRAGVTGHERAGWPVVLAGDQIVWIPGVRRGDAATARSGRPGLTFACDYHRS